MSGDLPLLWAGEDLAERLIGWQMDGSIPPVCTIVMVDGEPSVGERWGSGLTGRGSNGQRVAVSLRAALDAWHVWMCLDGFWSDSARYGSFPIGWELEELRKRAARARRRIARFERVLAANPLEAGRFADSGVCHPWVYES